MTRSISLIAILTVLFAPSGARGAGLKPKLKPGVGIHYVVNLRSDQTWKIESAPGEPPREIKRVSESEVGMRLRCSEVRADGSAVLAWTLLYITMSTEGSAAMKYDSRDPAQADSPEAYLLEQIINQPATVTIDATGEVLEYKDPPSLGGGPIRELMSPVFTEEAFENLGLFLTRGAPADAAVGSVWSQTQSRDLPDGRGSTLVNSDYKLDGLEDDGKTARITVDGTVAMNKPKPAEDGGAAAPPGMVIDKGTHKGVGRWDCAAGQAISGDFSGTVTGTIRGSFGSADFETIRTGKIKRTMPEEFQRALAPRVSPPSD